MQQAEVLMQLATLVSLRLLSQVGGGRSRPVLPHLLPACCGGQCPST